MGNFEFLGGRGGKVVKVIKVVKVVRAFNDEGGGGEGNKFFLVGGWRWDFWVVWGTNGYIGMFFLRMRSYFFEAYM